MEQCALDFPLRTQISLHTGLPSPTSTCFHLYSLFDPRSTLNFSFIYFMHLLSVKDLNKYFFFKTVCCPWQVLLGGWWHAILSNIHYFSHFGGTVDQSFNLGNSITRVSANVSSLWSQSAIMVRRLYANYEWDHAPKKEKKIPKCTLGCLCASAQTRSPTCNSLNMTMRLLRHDPSLLPGRRTRALTLHPHNAECEQIILVLMLCQIRLLYLNSLSSDVRN